MSDLKNKPRAEVIATEAAKESSPELSAAFTRGATFADSSRKNMVDIMAAAADRETQVMQVVTDVINIIGTNQDAVSQAGAAKLIALRNGSL